jgi:hypothetical protein
MKNLTALLFLVLSASAGALEPFFDNNPRTPLQPDPPELTVLDKDVLQLCGNWGSRVNKARFIETLLAERHKDTLDMLYRELGRAVFKKVGNKKAFVDRLAKVWFDAKGFQHIFCGEPSARSLGGLHYGPRYWQAQKNAWAGFYPTPRGFSARKDSCSRIPKKYRNIQDKGVYSLSTEYKHSGLRKSGIKCQGGYHAELDAAELLLAATQALKEAGRKKHTACYVTTNIKGSAPHYSNIVVKHRAIRTFYPVVGKPYCKKNRRNFKACLCSNTR